MANSFRRTVIGIGYRTRRYVLTVGSQDVWENSPGEPMDWIDPGRRAALAARIRLNRER
jgi:hypothetical protein